MEKKEFIIPLSNTTTKILPGKKIGEACLLLSLWLPEMAIAIPCRYSITHYEQTRREMLAGNVVGPDERDMKPGSPDAFRMIQNTLSNEGLKYIQLDKNECIDKGLLNSHTSKSGNFNALSTLVNSEFDIQVNLGTSYTYKDANGNIQKSDVMSYFGPDAEFMDTGFNQVSGVTTGESGFMGKTLLPGNGISGENSLNDSRIDIIINSNLSDTGRAEMYSHEANGHAVMYINTRDRSQSRHQGNNWVETNLPLAKKILDSRREVTNMRNR